MNLNNYEDVNRLPAYVAERPNFGPRQVRGLEKIVPNAQFTKVNAGGGRSRITIVGNVYEKPDGSSWVKVRDLNMEYELALADLGIVADTNGKWNRTNHILVPDS